MVVKTFIFNLFVGIAMFRAGNMRIFRIFQMEENCNQKKILKQLRHHQFVLFDIANDSLARNLNFSIEISKKTKHF